MSADSVNNVERIELSGLVPGDRLTFVVHGFDIRHSLLTDSPDALLPQRWAVAVVGHFKGTLQTPLNPAYMRPPRLQVGQMLPRTALPVVFAGDPLSSQHSRQMDKMYAVQNGLRNRIPKVATPDCLICLVWRCTPPAFYFLDYALLR